jgi:hypothetical protein
MNRLKYIKPEICVIACKTDHQMLQDSSHRDSTSSPTEENSGAELGAKSSNLFDDEDDPTAGTSNIWDE